MGRGVGLVRSGGRSVSWVGASEEWRKIGELGRRVRFVVAGLVQIGDGGKERNSEGRWRRKCEERDSWMK